MRRGFFLTFDALIALSVILVGVYAVNSVAPTKVASSVNYEQMHYTAEDAMTLFSITKLKELDQDYVEYLLENTNLTDEDTDKSLIECVALLWAYDQIGYAENLTRTFLDGFFGKFNYSLSIRDSSGNERLVYSSAGVLPDQLPGIKAITSASRLVSGYKEQALPRGYMARAVAKKSQADQTIIIPIEPAGSSYGNGDRLRFTKKFRLDFDEKNITEAMLYLSIHSGVSNYNSNTFLLDGTSIKGIGSIIYSEEEDCYNTQAWYVEFNVTDILRNNYDRDWHTLYVELLEQSNYNGHFHPGGYIKITHSSIVSSATINKTKVEKKYFDDLYSEGSANKPSGVWAIMPIEIPKSASVNNVTLHIRATGVVDTYDPRRQLYGLDPDTDVWVFFNDQLVFQEKNPPSVYDKSLDLTELVRNSQNDTNVVYISIDSYPSYDLFWGTQDLELYSDPENDPENSSYLFLNYTLSGLDKYRYGYMTLELAEDFGGAVENPKEKEFNFSNHDIFISRLHIAQLFSTYPEVYVRPESGPERLVFKTPLARVTPSSIIIDPSYYNVSVNNTIRMEDVVDVCSDRAFLPTSRLSYTLFIPSQVSYGDVFDTLEEAEADAIERLENLLSQYMDILEIDSYVKAPMSAMNVPSMYGPSIVILKVWV